MPFSARFLDPTRDPFLASHHVFFRVFLARGLGTFDWLGVSFGLTAQLFRFWSRAKYRAVVMSHAPNDLTGEMSMKMLLPLSDAPPGQ